MMNHLIDLLLLSTALTFAICDRKADIKCLNDRKKALEGLSDQKLYDLSQENLNVGSDMVAKRVKTAVAAGFTCYGSFYQTYVQGLSNILQTGLKQRLDKAKTPKERSDATKIIAGITQAVRCDEDWRAQHIDQLIGAANCTAQENYRSLDVNRFKPRLALLEAGMLSGKFALRFKNNVVSAIVGEMEKLYRKIYLQGEQCAGNLATDQKCRNMKIFVQELDRLFYLFEIQLLAKLSS